MPVSRALEDCGGEYPGVAEFRKVAKRVRGRPKTCGLWKTRGPGTAEHTVPGLWGIHMVLKVL